MLSTKCLREFPGPGEVSWGGHGRAVGEVKPGFGFAQPIVGKPFGGCARPQIRLGAPFGKTNIHAPRSVKRSGLMMLPGLRWPHVEGWLDTHVGPRQEVAFSSQRFRLGATCVRDHTCGASERHREADKSPAGRWRVGGLEALRLMPGESPMSWTLHGSMLASGGGRIPRQVLPQNRLLKMGKLPPQWYRFSKKSRTHCQERLHCGGVGTIRVVAWREPPHVRSGMRS